MIASFLAPLDNLIEKDPHGFLVGDRVAQGL
jgi:hypothetical protein